MADETKQKEDRGPKHPSDNLETAVEMLHRVRDGIGYSPANRETIVEALGYQGLSGTSARKLAVLNHFNLLDRVGNSTYRIGELGKRILAPREESEVQVALAEAAKAPSLYQRLFARFGDSALPSLLPNILMREFGVLSQTADEVARLFRETAEFAGLLRNGVLHTELLADPSAAGDSAPSESSDPRPNTAADESSQAGPPAGVQRYSVPLDKSGRVAMVELPLPLLVRDVERMISWLNYMMTITADEETPTVS